MGAGAASVRSGLLIAVAVSACGRVGYDALDAVAGAADAGALDAAIAIDPFGPPVLIDELSVDGQVDDDPTLTADMLEIYFNRTGDPMSRRVWRSTRSSPTATWDPPEEVLELRPGFELANPEVSFDGLTLHFAARLPSRWDIFRATRSDRSSPWTTGDPVAEVNSTWRDLSLVMDETGLRATMHSDRGGLGVLDLYQISRADRASPWSAPARMDLSDAADDESPFLSRNGLTLLFSSDRPGRGGSDLYEAVRATTSSAFGPPRPIDSINSAGADRDPWLSPDGRTLFFSNDRDLFVARR